MTKTAIITDSNSGILEQEAEYLGIYTVPMPVVIEGQVYYEGKNLTHAQFYQQLLKTYTCAILPTITEKKADFNIAAYPCRCDNGMGAGLRRRI